MHEAIQDIRRFIDDRRGTTSIEYVVIATCVFFAIIAGLTAIGSNLATVLPVITAHLN
jgi:Flp pilus assembly pilin Flp